MNAKPDTLTGLDLVKVLIGAFFVAVGLTVVCCLAR